MIAKINFDGKDRLAIVLDETMGFEYLNRFRHALNSYMETANAMYDAHGCDYVIHEDAYYLHALLEEMEFSVNQEEEMTSAYFGKKPHLKTAEKQPCEIYI